MPAATAIPSKQERSKTMYCFSCGKPRKLNTMKMCAECMTLWLSATPADRRRLLHVVKP